MRIMGLTVLIISTPLYAMDVKKVLTKKSPSTQTFSVPPKMAPAITSAYLIKRCNAILSAPAFFRVSEQELCSQALGKLLFLLNLFDGAALPQAEALRVRGFLDRLELSVNAGGNSLQKIITLFVSGFETRVKQMLTGARPENGPRAAAKPVTHLQPSGTPVKKSAVKKSPGFVPQKTADTRQQLPADHRQEMSPLQQVARVAHQLVLKKTVGIKTAPKSAVVLQQQLPHAPAKVFKRPLPKKSFGVKVLQKKGIPQKRPQKFGPPHRRPMPPPPGRTQSNSHAFRSKSGYALSASGSGQTDDDFDPAQSGSVADDQDDNRDDGEDIEDSNRGTDKDDKDLDAADGDTNDTAPEDVEEPSGTGQTDESTAEDQNSGNLEDRVDSEKDQEEVEESERVLDDDQELDTADEDTNDNAPQEVEEPSGTGQRDELSEDSSVNGAQETGQVDTSTSFSQGNGAGPNYSDNESISAATAIETDTAQPTFVYTVYPQREEPYGASTTSESSRFYSGTTSAPSTRDDAPNSAYITTPGLDSDSSSGARVVVSQTIPSHVDPGVGPNSAYVASPGLSYAAQTGATFITQEVDTSAPGLVPNSAYYITPGTSAVYQQPQTELRPDDLIQGPFSGTTPVLVFPGPKASQPAVLNQFGKQSEAGSETGDSQQISSSPSQLQTPQLSVPGTEASPVTNSDVLSPNGDLLIDPSKVSPEASVFAPSEESASNSTFSQRFEQQILSPEPDALGDEAVDQGEYGQSSINVQEPSLSDTGAVEADDSKLDSEEGYYQQCEEEGAYADNADAEEGSNQQLDAEESYGYTADAEEAYASNPDAEEGYNEQLDAEEAYASNGDAEEADNKQLDAEEAYADNVDAEEAYDEQLDAEEAYADNVDAEEAYNEYCGEEETYGDQQDDYSASAAEESYNTRFDSGDTYERPQTTQGYNGSSYTAGLSGMESYGTVSGFGTSYQSGTYDGYSQTFGAEESYQDDTDFGAQADAYDEPTYEDAYQAPYQDDALAYQDAYVPAQPVYQPTTQPVYQPDYSSQSTGGYDYQYGMYSGGSYDDGYNNGSTARPAW